jgi:hypothetical protein
MQLSAAVEVVQALDIPKTIPKFHDGLLEARTESTRLSQNRGYATNLLSTRIYTTRNEMLSVENASPQS